MAQGQNLEEGLLRADRFANRHAFQPSPGPGGSVGLAVVPLGGTGTPEVEYATYAGAAGPFPGSARIDGDGGVYIGMQFINDQGHPSGESAHRTQHP